MVSFARSFTADHEVLSALRQSVSEWLADQVESDQALVADVAVVLTELAANVIDHTDAAEIDIDLRVGDADVTLEVANAGPVGAVPPIEQWGHLREGDRGRGLRLIAALCDEVVVSGDDLHTRIRCRCRLR